MGLIKTLSEQARDITSRGKKYKDTGDNIRAVFKKDKKPSVLVANEISREEFSKRYNNLRIVAVVSGVLSLIALFMMPFSESFLRFGFTVTASMWFAMLYYRYAFRMWIARQGWISWRTISKEVDYEQKVFLQELRINPSEILPLSLKKI